MAPSTPLESILSPKWDAPEVIELLQSLLPVLQFIHNTKIIHRDIKPSNIILNAVNHNYHLVDFGASKITDPKKLSVKKTIVVSAGYSPPEQARGDAIFSSDIFSLGVTCIYLLTGIEPEKIIDPVSGRYAWRDFLRGITVRESFATLIDRMIVQDPIHRFQSANTALSAVLNCSHEIKKNAIEQRIYFLEKRQQNRQKNQRNKRIKQILKPPAFCQSTSLITGIVTVTCQTIRKIIYALPTSRGSLFIVGFQS